MQPQFLVKLKILKPPDEVFEAVVNPAKLSGYFVENSSGPLREGTTVTWKFQELLDEFEVVVRNVEKDRRIAFDWPTHHEGQPTTVEMAFEPIGLRSTLMKISEYGWPDEAKGRELAYGNCGGWMHMMACLKAYLEYGINLRAGGAV